MGPYYARVCRRHRAYRWAYRWRHKWAYRWANRWAYRWVNRAYYSRVCTPNRPCRALRAKYGGGKYKKLFNGCPRGGRAKRWVRKGNFRKAQCEALCNRDSKCNAIEVNGCRKNRSQCGGACYLFYGTGRGFRNGRCVTNGDQVAWAKPGRGEEEE